MPKLPDQEKDMKEQAPEEAGGIPSVDDNVKEPPVECPAPMTSEKVAEEVVDEAPKEPVSREEYDRLVAELEKERGEFEVAKARLAEVELKASGAQGAGVRLAPNRIQLNQIRRMYQAGGTPAAISQLLRIDIISVKAHCEAFEAEELPVQPGANLTDLAETAGGAGSPKSGLPPEIGD